MIWTTLGAFVPAVILSMLGALAGTAVDMTDPQTSFAAILPKWFYPVFLLVIIVSSITNNVITAYSSGLALQAVGIKARRAVTVRFDGVVAVSLTIYALFISNFFDALNNFLSLSVAVLGPCIAIYVTDSLLRRNQYDGLQLSDESPQSPFWYDHGVCWPGVVAEGLGTSRRCSASTARCSSGRCSRPEGCRSFGDYGPCYRGLRLLRDGARRTWNWWIVRLNVS